MSFHFLENLNNCIRQLAEGIDYGRASFAQRFHFAGMRASAAFNDRARVTEARAFSRSLPADVRDHRFGDFSIDDQLRQFLFLRGTDFAKDHDRFRERILFEHQCRVWQANSNHRVTADVHNGRNAHACLPKIVAGTRSHAAGATNHPYALRHAGLKPLPRALRATADHPDHALART